MEKNVLTQKVNYARTWINQLINIKFICLQKFIHFQSLQNDLCCHLKAAWTINNLMYIIY